MKNIDISVLEEEVRKLKYKDIYFSIFKKTLYTLIILISSANILITIFIPILKITNDNMNPKYKNNDIILTYKTKNIDRGDIIAFYYDNKILVKRVIGLPNEYINIDNYGNVYINGILYKEYSKEVEDIQYDLEFPYKVSELSYFVLNDNRMIMQDSRNKLISSVKEEDIIGKVLFRIYPF